MIYTGKTGLGQSQRSIVTRISMRVLAVIGILVGAQMASRSASAHSVLTMPVPRVTGMPGSGLTAGPCGGAVAARTATQPVAPLTAGAQLNIAWSETINHPGCFIVDFSTAADANFTQLAIFPHTTVGALPRPYAQTVTLPATPCAACTLRLRQIQLAADPAAGTCPQTGITTYFTCANVTLAGDTGNVPDAGAPEVGGGATGGRAGTGTGGANGTGGRGANGTGGAPAGSGGTTGGNPRGGADGGVPNGTGGATGPTAGSGGTTAIGVPGTGGAVVTTTGGSTGSPSTGAAGNPGTGGASSSGANVSDQPSGCACAVASSARQPGSLFLMGLFVALVLRRTRIRRKP